MVQTCKLYRNLYEIFHPSISRKNITEYKIVLDEDILPIQVFYPEKDVELERVILYIPGLERDTLFYDELAKQMNSMVFLLEFIDQDVNHQYEKTINYIWEQLKMYSVQDGLSFMADGDGCCIINSLNGFVDQKKVFISPLSNFKSQVENYIIITNKEEYKGQDSYSFVGDFSRIIEEDGLAIRESIFSIIRGFIPLNERK